MYPSDFEAADAVFTPNQDNLFLGLPPLLALILFLLLLAIAAGMFFLGRWHADQSGSRDAERAPDDIHRAILHASMAAMAASSDELKARAKALRTAIDDHLGPVLEVGKGVNGTVKDLDAALKGEIRETRPDDRGHGHGHGGDHHPAAQAGVPPVTVNQIFVGGPPPPPHGGHDDGHRADKPKPETRPMTGPEQVEALSKAVRAFHDHWSHGPDRVRELREARRALSRRPSFAALRATDGRVRTRH
ncbi:hypothetical protein [Brevundimonas sp. TWP2-3-2]|uniref:hypothetical protein n=1 Tax=unclassified Brevundimonas TaxID=2622653 RepID=UPI003CF62EEC